LRRFLWVCAILGILGVGWVLFAGGLPSSAGWLVLLLCPLLHLAMMLGGRSCHGHGDERKGGQRDAVVDQEAVR